MLSAGYYDAYYRKAQQVRALITRDFQEAFKKVDLIVTPTSPAPAFKLGEKTADPLAMYLADIYTVTGDLSGMTGISVPCGLTPEGLPVGLQIFGPHFGEARVLQLAHAFEQTTQRELARNFCAILQFFLRVFIPSETSRRSKSFLNVCAKIRKCINFSEKT